MVIPRRSRYLTIKDLVSKAIIDMVFMPQLLNSEVAGPSGIEQLSLPGQVIRPQNSMLCPKHGSIKGPLRPNSPSWLQWALKGS